MGPHQRGKQDTDLARRRDIADRREDHGGQHEDIGKRAEQGNQDHGLPLPGPGGLHLFAAPEGERSHHDHPAEVGAPVLQDGRDQHGAHRLFVDDCIRRDHATGEQRERDSARGARLAQLGRVPREKESSPNHERCAAEGDHARSLAEHGDRDQNRKERARRARERIDDREIAIPVAAVKQQIIGGMEQGACEDEGERGRRKVEVLKVHDRRRKRGVEQC